MSARHRKTGGASPSALDVIKQGRRRDRCNESRLRGRDFPVYYRCAGFVPSGVRKCHKSPAFVWEKMWE